uniref:Uncharacterized protein n=1 Tax=Oryza barthii TaxID=65489 RepID=A0A0D3HPW5_9ORYZ
MPNSSLGEGVSGGDGARRRWRREREREREQDELQLTLFRVPARKKLFLNRAVHGRLEAIEKSFSLETVKDIVDAIAWLVEKTWFPPCPATISYALAFNHAAACPRSNRGAVPRTSSPFPPSNTAVVARSSARAPRCRRIRRPSLLVVEPSSNPPCHSGMQKLADELDSEQLGLESKIMTIMNLEDPHPYPQ